MRRAVILLIALGVLGVPAAAQALEPEQEQADQFEEDWTARFDRKDAESFPLLLEEWRDFLLVHGYQGFLRREWPSHVERWRTLIDDYFQPADVETALAIIACESSGDPKAKNPRSSASGLWQHLAKYWERRSRRAGIPGSSIFDPEASTIVAARLVYGTSASWGHWSCAP